MRPNIERPPWSTEIARLHGGEITATSPEGGSEFAVSLPLPRSRLRHTREWTQRRIALALRDLDNALGQPRLSLDCGPLRSFPIVRRSSRQRLLRASLSCC